MNTTRSVTMIQPTISRNMPGITPIQALRRVAAYARVSTDSEEQQTSYEAQIDYYTKLIKDRPDELLGNRDEVIANCQLTRDVLCDCSEIDTKIDDLKREIEMIARQSRKLISENAHVALSQDEFNERNNEFFERHRIVLERIAELECAKRERMNRVMLIDGFIRELKTRPLVIDEFDERLWVAAVERVTIGVDGEMVFGFRGRGGPCVR